jgi:lipopolysaccharide export system protein LptC
MNDPYGTAAGEPADQEGWRGSADLEPRFRSAMAHSRRVKLLRRAVPLTIGLTLAGIAAVALFNPFRDLPDLRDMTGSLSVSGSRITMELPRLSGFTRDSRAYELAAKSAVQDITNPHMVELRDIRAKVEMPDKAMVDLSAESGIYDTKGEIVSLNRGIVIQSSTGYEGRLSEAVVDVRKGHIHSRKPVEVLLLNGVLNANKLEIVDSGALVRFADGVAMTLNVDKDAVASRRKAEGR